MADETSNPAAHVEDVAETNEPNDDAGNEDVELIVASSDKDREEESPSSGHQANVHTVDSMQESLHLVSDRDGKKGHFSWCQSTMVAHCCIDRWEVVHTKDDDGNIDAHLEVTLVPEAFRMWFYYGWWIFIGTAIIVSLMFADIPYDDNVFIENFNGLSICIFFDYAPFGYFGALLWMPQIINLCIYEVLDIYRVYDCHLDGLLEDGVTPDPKVTDSISRKFFNWYAASTLFEICGFIGFIQTMATSPMENWKVHSVPYLIMTYGLWTMAFKRFMYLRETGRLEDIKSGQAKWSKLKLYAGWTYVILLFIAMFFKTSILWPNFFGAKLWLRPAWAWTDRLLQYSVYVWFLLTLIVPIVIYWVITEELDTVKLVLNRKVFQRRG